MFGFGGCGGYYGLERGSQMWPGFAFMGILCMAFLILIVMIIIKLSKKGKNKDKEFINLLNVKLANGEISEEEYIKRKETLLK